MKQLLWIVIVLAIGLTPHAKPAVHALPIFDEGMSRVEIPQAYRVQRSGFPRLTLNVNTTVDTPDAAINGMCADEAGACSLRAAIDEARAAAPGSTINVPAGVYALSLSYPVAGNSGHVLDNSMLFQGDPNGETIIEVDSSIAPEINFRLFFIGTQPDKPLVTIGFNNVSFRGGRAKGTGNDGFGGAFNVQAANLLISNSVLSNHAAANGGGVLAASFESGITIQSSTITANTAQQGAAVYAQDSSVGVMDSTIHNNTVIGVGGGTFANVSLGYVGSTSTNLYLYNSTLAYNTYPQPGASIGTSGIFSTSQDVTADNKTNSASLMLHNSTIIGNSGSQGSPAPHGIVQLSYDGTPNTVSYVNSILAGNSGECYSEEGMQASDGGNVFSAPVSDCMVSANDILYMGALDTILETTLSNNGGKTQTLALVASSPAINAGIEEHCPATDQRGVARPIGVTCDAGAYEFEGITQTATPTLQITPTGEITATPSPEMTATMTDEATPTPDPTADVTPTSQPSLELLSNGGFEGDMSAWTAKNATGDKQKCNKPDKVIAFEGECVYQFKGGTGEKSKLIQRIDHTLVSEGDTLTLGGVVTAKGAVNAKVRVVISYNDTTLAKDKITVSLNAPVVDYAAFTGELSIIAAGEPTKIQLQINNRSTSGRLRFDAFTLQSSNSNTGLLSLP
jgi:CSLREA domain-containing protein